MFRTDLKPGEAVRIDGPATITFEGKSGQAARLSFDADRSVSIKRVTGSASPASIAASSGISGGALSA